MNDRNYTYCSALLFVLLSLFLVYLSSKYFLLEEQLLLKASAFAHLMSAVLQGVTIVILSKYIKSCRNELCGLLVQQLI